MAGVRRGSNRSVSRAGIRCARHNGSLEGHARIPSGRRHAGALGRGIRFQPAGQVIHMLGLGVQPDILDKVSRASGPQRAADEISRQGGVAVLAHPAWSLNPPSTMCALSGVTARKFTTRFPARRGRGSGGFHLAFGCNGRPRETVSLPGHGRRSFLQRRSVPFLYHAASRKPHAGRRTRSPEERRFLRFARAGNYRYTFDGEVFTIDCSPASRIVFSSDLNWVNGRCVAGETSRTRSMWCKPTAMSALYAARFGDANGLCAWTSPVAVGPNCH